MNHTQRGTAINPAFTRRETRDEPNPFDRIFFAGTASNKFQILRKTPRGRLVPFGSYDSLEQALEARDSSPEYMPPKTNLITAPYWHTENE